MQKAKLFQQANQIAQNYDPVQDAQGAVQFAQKVAGKTLDESLTRARMDFGGRTDDTRFIPIAQRATDDPLNALAQTVVEARMNAPMKKLQALQAAISVADPGEVAARTVELERTRPQPDLLGSANQIATAIDGLTQPKKSQSAATIAKPKLQLPNASDPAQVYGQKLPRLKPRTIQKVTV